MFFCVGAGISTLMSFSDGSGSHFFRRKLEKTQTMREKMDGKVLIMFTKAPESEIFVFMVNVIKILFPISTLMWRVNNCVARRQGINKRTECTIIIIIVYLLYTTNKLP